MKTIVIDNFKLNITNIHKFVERNEVHTKIELCNKKDADIKVVVKDRDIDNKRFKYTSYYKYIQE